MFTSLLRLLVCLSLILSSPVLASEGGGGYGGSTGGGGAAGGLSAATTKKVVRTLKRGIKDCRRLNSVYRYDCYRQTYRLAANHLNGRPAYRDALAALVAVERSLEQIVSRNADPAAPPLRKRFQQFQPIKPAALPKAKAQFTTALDQAETALLRSPDQGGAHFARIAEAVHSNKVLLRTLLDPGRLEPVFTQFA
ncbi:MAG: hypothetical protein ACI8R4_000318 [Paracoccaceae bacterium]|jgi:hypothetical protein